MKRITLFFVLIFLASGLFAQIAYQDAMELRKKYIVVKGDSFAFKDDATSISEIAIRLKNYLPEIIQNDSTTNETQVLTRYNSNPFLKSAIQEAVGGSSATSVPTVIRSMASGIGNFNVTNIADGIAQFLIKRGKEELNVAFFNKMKKFLDDKDRPEIKTLFPVTTEFLTGIETSRYAELIQSLREAFHKDLSNLVISLNQLIDLPKYRELLKELPEIRAAVRMSKIVSELAQPDENIYPDNIIHSLAGLNEWKQINSNLGNSLKLLDIFSQSLRETNPAKTRRWVGLSDLNALVNDKIALQIFIGLIFQQVKEQNIEFKIKDNIVRVDQFMTDNAKTISVISGLIENFALLANDVDRTIKDLKDKQENGKLNSDDYYTYIGKAINITEYGFKVANTIKDGVLDDKYVVMARNANDLYKNIYTKNYNNAVMNAYKILDQVFNKFAENENLSKEVSEKLKKFSQSGTIEKVLKYGNFMASVVKAESGEDVERALEAAALPAGSYSIKQKSEFNVSANGYIGYGFDFNSGLHARGIYAPLGISINFGSRRKFFPVVSAFVSFIDVGSVAAYRLVDDSTKKLKQEVRLESIFSPSFQLVVEPFRGFPLAIAAGWKRTPKLFYSNNASFTTVSPINVFNLSVLIDIPLFTITNIPFIKK